MKALGPRIRKALHDAHRAGSLVALVLVNLVPIAGVLFFDWRVFDLLLLYWAESVVIGLLNVPKMWIAVDRVGGTPGPTVGKVALSAFFLVHYGGFMAGHAVFMTLLTAGRDLFELDFEDVPGLILTTLSQPGIFLALVGLVASHTISMLLQFIGRREYLQTTADAVMAAPYPRVFVMQIAVIVGAFFVMLLQLPAGVLVILVLGKIVLDVHAHLREHERHAQDTPDT